MHRLSICAVSSALVISGLFVGSATAAPVATVSPDLPADVGPITSPGAPFQEFDDFSWRSFIALNWPAKAGAAGRGQPDTARAFGDAAGPRVWTTWKTRFEIFQPADASGQPVVPAAWQSYDGRNPCGGTVSNDVPTLSAFSAFGDFNQADFSMAALSNPLVAQNRTYLRYDVRVNETQFNSIVGHKWYIEANLPTRDAPVPFATGSIEVKAAWRILTAADTPEIRSRYFVVNGAMVFDVASASCVPQDIALVGLHIVSKTPSRPQWIWSSFEHVDNVPGITDEPTPPAGVGHSLNDGAKPQALDPQFAPLALSVANPPAIDPDPMQVVRQVPIEASTMATNRVYWALPEIKGTVWENYMLVMTQWPTDTQPEGPNNPGSPFPSDGSNLANTTMETYFQQDVSCMACHNMANRKGRDFVMFVTFDAFRPGVPTPATEFGDKLSFPPLAPASPDTQEMIQELTDFVQATKSAQ